jgi:hypothetical protein
LEPHSQTESSSDRRLLLEAQVRECYGRVVYSHKTHEKCADILLSRLSTIKFWQIALSSITTAGFLGSIFGKSTFVGVAGVIVSTLLLALNTYTKNYDLGALAQKHRQAAADLWLIREKYLSLITDLKIGSETLENLSERRDKIMDELHSVYSGAPSTISSAYRRAQSALKRSEEMTFSDSEIDLFLPCALRKG